MLLTNYCYFISATRCSSELPEKQAIAFETMFLFLFFCFQATPDWYLYRNHPMETTGLIHPL